MDNQPSLSTFRTRDLGLATFLITKSHELAGTTLEDPRKVIFEIKKREDTDRLILGYFNGTGEAEAKKLFETYRTLRGLVYTRTSNVR